MCSEKPNSEYKIEGSHLSLVIMLDEKETD